MKKLLENLAKSLFFLFLLGVFVFSVKAQSLPSPLSLAATPSSPSPGEIILLQAATPTVDENTVTFSWTVDGKTRPDLSGPGKKDFTLVAGDLGTSHQISVRVSGPNGVSGQVLATVRVSSLALTWFAEVYAPRWYKGKALPAPGSVVNIVAIPQIIIAGRTLRPENLIYSWSLDNEKDMRSGVGLQNFKIQVSDIPGASHRVNVKIVDDSGTIKKEGEVFIVSSAPRVAIYRSFPLGEGEYRSSPVSISTRVRGIFDFIAEPFFFPAVSKQNLSYRWQVSGNDSAGMTREPSSLSLRLDDPGEVNVPISVVVEKSGGSAFTLSATRGLNMLFQ